MALTEAVGRNGSKRSVATKVKRPATPRPVDGDTPPLTFTRPYIQESASFANRLELDLHYADNELAMLGAQIKAMQSREADLILVRDAALRALGVVQHVEAPVHEPDEGTHSDD